VNPARIRLIFILAVLLASLLLLILPLPGARTLEGLGKIFQNIKLGLDLSGGARLDYVMKVDESQSRDINQIAQQVVFVLRKRLDAAGYTEAQVRRVGAAENMKIRVEIPGVSDTAEAERLIGQRGRLFFGEVVDTETSDRQPIGKPLTARDAQWLRDMNDPNLWYLVNPKMKVGTRVYELDGSYVIDARAAVNTQRGGYLVHLVFNGEGGDRFAAITRAYIGRRIAIVLDNKVIIAPVVRDAITDGKAVIEGITNLQRAQEVAILIKSGNLPVDLEKYEEAVVGPTLGKDVLRASFIAAIVGGIAVMVYMIVTYGAMGIVADVALLYNMLVLLALLAATRSILTLPGIGGIILTFGAGVDGNIIIYERIKEELRAGKTVHAAIRDGFSKALITILDANITTLIAAGVLYYFGTGTIRGFAVTLTFGILGSMFTNLVVSRSMLDGIAPLMNVSRYLPKKRGADV